MRARSGNGKRPELDCAAASSIVVTTEHSPDYLPSLLIALLIFAAILTHVLRSLLFEFGGRSVAHLAMTSIEALVGAFGEKPRTTAATTRSQSIKVLVHEEFEEPLNGIMLT